MQKNVLKNVTEISPDCGDNRWWWFDCRQFFAELNLPSAELGRILLKI